MKKRLCALLLAGCMLLGLTACGAGGKSEEVSNVSLQSSAVEGLVYYASDLKLDVETSNTSVDFRTYGPSIYYPEGQTIETYSTMDRKTTVDTYMWENAPGEWFFERVCYSGTGEVYGLVMVGGAVPNLCKFDVERKLVFAKELAQYYQVTDANAFIQTNRLEVGSDGRVYLSNTDAVWIFEADGSFKGEVSFGDVQDVLVRDFRSDAGRNLYVLYEDNANQAQYVAEIDTETGAVSGVQRTIGLSGISATENGILGFNGAVVYRYDREVKALTELFHWSECNVNGSQVYNVCLLADGNVFAAGNVAGTIRNYLVKNMIIEKVEGSQTGKIDIVIAMYGSTNSDVLSQAVKRFNRNSERYNIIPVDYRKDGKDAGWARLRSELAQGTGADIIDLTIADVEELVEEDYLEDLALYLEESEVVSEGDFLQSALEEYLIDDMLVAIPHHCSIEVLVGNSDYIGDEQGWTMAEMMNLLEQNVGNRVFANEMDRYNFFRYMLQMNEEYFVDSVAGTCDFDNEIFRRMLVLAEDFPLEYERPAEGEVRPSEYTNLQDGNGILCAVSAIELQHLQPFEAALDGKINYIGFPNEDGIGVSVSFMDSLGISTSSQNKEGAWEFLEYFMQYSLTGGFYFPTYRPSMQTMAQWEMESGSEGEMGWGSDRWSFRLHRPTQEEVDTFCALWEAGKSTRVSKDILNIILEETEGYYTGEITIDSAIANIEKKVQAYLAQ